MVADESGIGTTREYVSHLVAARCGEDAQPGAEARFVEVGEQVVPAAATAALSTRRERAGTLAARVDQTRTVARVLAAT